MLILIDSNAVIAAIVKAGKKDRGRTKELREMADLIAKRFRKELKAVYLSWVKSHIEIKGNEVADKTAKRAAECL